jgi:hypothetical protein
MVIGVDDIELGMGCDVSHWELPIPFKLLLVLFNQFKPPRFNGLLKGQTLTLKKLGILKSLNP